MYNQSAEELILAAIIAEKRRQEKANKGKPTQEPVIPKSLQRAFNLWGLIPRCLQRLLVELGNEPVYS